MLRFLMVAVIAVPFLQATVASTEPLTVFTKGRTIVVSDLEHHLLTVEPMFWGPGWKFGGVEGEFRREGNAAVGQFEGTIRNSDVSYELSCRATLRDRTLRVRYVLDPESTGECELLAIGVEPGQPLDGEDAARVLGAEGRNSYDLPLGTGSFGDGVQRMVFGRGEQRFAVSVDPPHPVQTDQWSARIVVARGRVPSDPMRVTVNVGLPRDAVFYPTPDDVPMPQNWEDWFPWQADSDTSKESVIDMTEWQDAPAGRHGWIERDGAELLYHGEPIEMWGLNNAYSACAPGKELADKRAAFYSKYGINTVRLHKLAQGHGWAGIQSAESVVEFDPEGLDRLDYYIAALKEKGIYVKFSVALGWGIPLGPKDDKYVPYLDELGDFGKGRASRINPGHGAIYWSPELQKVKILQLTNLLRHRNPYTGKTYAEDPAVFVVEMTNEESIYWYTTMRTMLQHERLRDWAAKQFCEWLRDRYGDEDALLDAWGEDALNTFEEEGVGSGESLAENSIVPVGNIWFFDPERLQGSQAPRRARLLDTMEFLHELQNRFYNRFGAAIRDTGYKGLIETSNWQAGRDRSHYYNLHSDYRFDLIDRHNYYGNGPSMLRVPGSGILSAGMQQVADRPFSISEWIHTFPNERGVEGPAIIGAYGFGLQGWDISFMFENRDQGEFSERFGRQAWDVTAPHILGVFPAVARQVRRRDVKTAQVSAPRNVHVPSMARRGLDFEDTIRQQHDMKVLDSDKVPARTLAVARTVVNFTDRPTPTPEFNLNPYKKDGTYVSSTGQLRWTPMDAYEGRGYFTMDTSASQAVVGYASSRKAELGQVDITSHSPFAAIYVTALEQDEDLRSGSRWLITTMARLRNTDMVFVGRTLLRKGKPPIRMEPVKATIRIKRGGGPTVHVLDHDGRRTGRTVPVRNGVLELDGARTRAVYYEVVFD